MQPIHTAYPQFAPNQVLSSSHLNQLYDYLNEQGRLTRTHLIGLGIVCGLEAELNAAGSGITISRGCGVTSAGHLVIWDEDEPLEFHRPYTMPEDIDYPFFDLPGSPSETYPLWELTTDRDDDDEAVGLTRDFLTGEEQEEGEGDQKVLLLLFECRVVDNRNCTPNSCDDKGRTVETAVRPLLIRRGDLEEIRRVLREEHEGVEAYYSLGASRAERLSLPTLRAPRFDVTNSAPATTYQLFDSYRRTLSQSLLDRVQSALDEAYASLAPLLPDYASNPFADRVTDLRFLADGSMLNDSGVLAYPYYFEHIVNLIQAYTELRARAEELFSICCPDDRTFPRHLVLHHYTEAGWSDEMRHEWVSSPVQNRQAGARAELRSLFDRIVALLDGFDLDIATNSRQPDIRITPNFLGRPLSEKAVPYYYDPSGLLTLWNYQLTRRGREDENLGYRATTWNGTDDFVRNPLNYDPEPRNFLRIEGATGANYLAALQNIRSQIDAYRLPIDLVALRTGGQVDEDAEGVEVPDLQLHYATWRERLLGRIAEVAVRFYDIRLVDPKGNAAPGGFAGTPRAELLQRLTGYQYFNGTLGWFYEQNFDQHGDALPHFGALHTDYYVPLIILHLMVRLEGQFPDRLVDLDFAEAEDKLANLQGGGRFLARFAALTLNDAAGGVVTGTRIDREEVSDQMDELITAGDLDALRALYASYQERRTAALRGQLFADFQREHPGLQFRAGTELGGTFVLVYHGAGAEDAPFRRGSFRLAGMVVDDGEGQPGVTVSALGTNLATTTRLNGMFSLSVNYLPITLRFFRIGAGGREVSVVREEDFIRIDLGQPVVVDDEREIEGLTAGTVVADFYLPYRCCGGGMPIHIFPEATEPEPDPLTVAVEQVSCTRRNSEFGVAQLEVTVTGGTPPYFRIDEQGNSSELSGDPIAVFGDGTIVVEDTNGDQAEASFTLLPELTAAVSGQPRCADDNATYDQDFTVSGGRPPYTYIGPDGSEQSVTDGTTATVAGIPSGQSVTVLVRDTFGENCGTQLVIAAHRCVDVNPDPDPDPDPTCSDILPCGGIVIRESFPFWLHAPTNAFTEYRQVAITVEGIAVVTDEQRRVELEDGPRSDLNDEIARILTATNRFLNESNFNSEMGRVTQRISATIREHVDGSFELPPEGEVLRIDYEANPSFDRLTVESFECFSYELVVRVEYGEAASNANFAIPRVRTVAYSNREARVEMSIELDNQPETSEAVAPSFDRFRVDRCEPNVPGVPLCTATGLSTGIRIEGQGPARQVTAVNAGRQTSVFWEVGFGVPPISNQRSFGVGFAGNDRSAPIRLLVVDPDTGCFAIATDSVGL